MSPQQAGGARMWRNLTCKH